MHNPIGTHNCEHSDDVGVTCIKRKNNDKMIIIIVMTSNQIKSNHLLPNSNIN